MTIPPIRTGSPGDSSDSSPRVGKKEKKSKKERQQAVTYQKVKLASDTPRSSPDLRVSGRLTDNKKISKASSLPPEGSDLEPASVPLTVSDSHTLTEVRVRRRSSIIRGQSIAHPSSTETPGEVSPPPPKPINETDKPKSSVPKGAPPKPTIQREYSVLAIKSENPRYGTYADLHIEVTDLKKALKAKNKELSHASVADKPAIEKEISRISAEMKEKNQDLNALAEELLKNREEFGKLLRDPNNHSVINSMLTVRSAFLADRDKSKALAYELVANYPLEQLAGVLRYYVKKSISNTELPTEALREVDTTLAFMLSMVQKKYMAPLIGKELAEICKDLEKIPPNKFVPAETTKEVFTRILGLLIRTDIPKPMQELYQSIQNEFLRKWPDLENKEKRALRLVTAVFFLQLVNPTIARGPKANEVYNFAYKTEIAPSHAILLSKGLQAIVNNEPSNDKNLQNEKFHALIQEMQTFSHSIARNLRGRHTKDDKKP